MTVSMVPMWSALGHAACTPIDAISAADLLAWAAGGPGPTWVDGDMAWLLSHNVDGVVWGRLGGGAWSLASSEFPDHSGSLGDPARLLEMRMFGATAEYLVWGDGGGHVIGRRLADDATPCLSGVARSTGPDPDVPADDKRLLLGTRTLARGSDFEVVADRAGSRHAMPLLGTGGRARLCLRHYWRRAEPPHAMAGWLSIGGTRLVSLEAIP